eukprot:5833301-Ditylum_brightwellii.AAC.1
MNEKRARALEELGFVYLCARQMKEKTNINTLAKSNNQEDMNDENDQRKTFEQHLLSNNDGKKEEAGSDSEEEDEESYVENEGEIIDFDSFHSCDWNKLFEL